VPVDPLGPTHEEFQGQIVQLAHTLGWRHLHTRRTIGKHRRWVTATNLKGWPDLMLMRPPDGLIFAELKIPPDKPSPEQEELLEYLAGYPFAISAIWTPADWDIIEHVLAAHPRRQESSGTPRPV
jgi:hypothetical protein